MGDEGGFAPNIQENEEGEIRTQKLYEENIVICCRGVLEVHEPTVEPRLSRVMIGTG